MPERPGISDVRSEAREPLTIIQVVTSFAVDYLRPIEEVPEDELLGMGTRLYERALKAASDITARVSDTEQ